MRWWCYRFIFWFLVAQCLRCFFFLVFLSAFFGLVVSSDFFSVSSFFVSCLYSRFLFCVYHEVCIRCLVESGPFSADSIFFCLCRPTLLFPLLWLASNYPLHVRLLPNWQGFLSCSALILSVTLLRVWYFCPFVSCRRAPFHVSMFHVPHSTQI